MFVRLIADRRGVSAIEFSLVLPILLAILFGSVEFSRAVDNRRKVTLLAHTIANLSSQGDKTNPVAIATMHDIFASSKLVLRPFNVADAKIVVSAMGVNLLKSALSPQVCSSFASENTTARSLGNAADLTIPAGFNQTGMRYIIAEVTMKYTPIFGSSIAKLWGGASNAFTFKFSSPWPVRGGEIYKPNTYQEIVLPNGKQCA